MKVLKSVAELAVSIVSMVNMGYVLSVMWSWFIVPTFGLPILGIAQSIGVSATVKLFAVDLSLYPSREEEEEFAGRVTALIARGWVVPWFILGVAWIVKQFI
jgi:hypothetical protein